MKKKAKKKKQHKDGDGIRTRSFPDSGQAIHPLCYEFFLWLVCAYNILHEINCMYYSKNNEL